MSERRNKLVTLTAELAADFATRAGEHDRANSFPVENVDKMKAAGYTALVIPEKQGGLGADLEDFALCQEQLAQGCAATTIAINMHLFGIGSMVERASGRPREELFFDVIGRGHRILRLGLSAPDSRWPWVFSSP